MQSCLLSASASPPGATLPSPSRPTAPPQARMFGATAAVSAFMNNTPLVAVMIPLVERWCRENRMPVSKFMMPLRWAADAALLPAALWEEAAGRCGARVVGPDALATGLTGCRLPAVTLPLWVAFAPSSAPAPTSSSGAWPPTTSRTSNLASSRSVRGSASLRWADCLPCSLVCPQATAWLKPTML